MTADAEPQSPPEFATAHGGGVSARAHVKRLDIQLLRALAILLVIAHHAHVPYLPGGFLGVDIFFVISGYLMTGIIDRELAERRFTFRRFYERRVRRLLPAAYATLLLCAAAMPWVLDGKEYREFVGQLAGSFGFVSNVVLWKQTDYFGTAATLKPLLHMWSLSIEEQFYIALPLLLFLTPARWRPALVGALVAASMALCLVMVGRNPSATFYLLPTRAWELGLGALVALAVPRGWIRSAPMTLLRLASAAVLLVVPLIWNEAGHPGLPALLVCLATAVLVVPGAADIRETLPFRILRAIGDRSYSLYLLHWPLMVAVAHLWFDAPPAWALAAMVALTFGLAELQYRYVEERFKAMTIDRRAIAFFVLVPLAVIGASYGYARATATPATIARGGGEGLSPACDFKGQFSPLAECRSGAAPSLIVWGDSHAMALAPGFAASTPGGIVQATRTVCGPFLGLAPIDGATYPRGWGESCIAFNQSVIDYIARTPAIRTVVLTTAMSQYVPGAEDRGWRSLVRSGDGFAERPQTLATWSAAVGETARAIRALGRRVIIVTPPPADGRDAARCIDRREHGLALIGASPDCSFSEVEYRAARAPVIAAIEALDASGAVPVMSLADDICVSGTCRATIEGTLLYRDASHLSAPGSRLLGERFDWGRTAIARAR